MKLNRSPDLFRSLQLPFIALVFLSVVGASLLPALGCQCPETFTPPCAFYSRADVVFVGTLLRTNRTSDHLSEDAFTGHFRVDETFKGLSDTEIKVQSAYSECNVPLRISDKYLIYARQDFSNSAGVLISHICEGTRLLADAGKQLEYLRALSKKKVSSSILGQITGIRGQELNGVKVKINGQLNAEAGVDAEGFFGFEVKQPGIYQVRIAIPLALRVALEPGINARNESTGTHIDYTAILKDNECDYRELKVTRIYSTGIIGNVIDENGRPVPRVSIQLFPVSSTDFAFMGGQITRTDEAGNYRFKSIKEGNYYLGVNLGKSPDFLAPYPTTFFPGVASLEKATVVSLQENQQLSLGTFRLPATLVEKIITGRLVWSDGSPVTKPAVEASTTINPNLYLLDFRSLLAINSARPDGSSTIRIDDNGGFSFVGYEGYTYVIHVDAVNSERQAVHAKHFKVTIGKDLKPLLLVLSIPGPGRSIDEIKKELGQMAGTKH